MVPAAGGAHFPQCVFFTTFDAFCSILVADFLSQKENALIFHNVTKVTNPKHSNVM